MEEQQNPMFKDQAELDVRIDGLYKVVKGKIDWSNIVPTTMEIAQEVEGMTQLRGSDRLELLQKTLLFALKDADLPKEKKDEIMSFIETVLPLVMQAAILASKVPILSKAQVAACWSCISRKK